MGVAAAQLAAPIRAHTKRVAPFRAGGQSMQRLRPAPYPPFFQYGLITRARRTRRCGWFATPERSFTSPPHPIKPTPAPVQSHSSRRDYHALPLVSTATARRPRASDVSLSPGSRIDHVQKNVNDTPAGPKGSVLVVEFTLAGQRFVALNGGRKAEYSHAVSFQIDCADQAEVDRLWDAILANGGREEACGWIRDRWDVPWQIVPSGLLDMISDPDTTKAARAMAAMMEMVKLDIATIRRAFEGG